VAADDDKPERTADMTGVGAEQRRAAAREATTQPIPPPITGPAPSNDPTDVLVPDATADHGPRVPPAPLHAGVFHEVDLPLVERDHYELLGEHARGGIGRIMRARDRRTGRLVALKEMLSPHSQALKRFTREALISANLQHPSIIPVYEIGSWSSGEPFIAMKLVAGRSLAEVLRGATLDDRLARLPVILSVAEALAYAHQRRIIHRDLKPANVLVGDHGETVVIDWGLAKSVDEIETTGEIERIPEPQNIDPTVAGVVLGTPAYMSPEPSRGVLPNYE
jgi:serine/threonine protein kinase